MVRQGRLPFIEHGGEQALAEVLKANRLQVTTDQQAIAQHDIVVLTIGTPVDEYLDPNVRTFDRATESVMSRMRSGQGLIVRSTVFPGVTDRLCKQAQQQNLDIDVAYCPERIVQGYAFEELSTLPQIVGGTTPRAAQRAAALFEKLGVEIVHTSAVEAELAKLFANAHRYITFAISNQFLQIAEKFDANFSHIRHAVTAQYPRLAGFAKAGFAGGPCLLKDTMQLAAFNHNSFAIGQAAMMVNEGLPQAVVDMAKQHFGLEDKKVAILGMAFKGNNDDPRSSLAYKLRKLLSLECRSVLCTDPYIADSDFVGLDDAMAQADLFFLGACHEEYRMLQIDKPTVDVFDFLQNCSSPLLNSTSFDAMSRTVNARIAA